MNITPLSQRDPKWAERLLGTSNLTIGEAGCLLTVITMVANYFGADLWPNELDVLLEYVGGYEQKNLFAWFAVGRVAPITVYDSGTCFDEPAPMDKLHKHIEEGRPVICKVDDWRGVRNDKREHYVLMIENDQCIDPWFGEVRPMANPARDVLSFYVYRRKNAL